MNARDSRAGRWSVAALCLMAVAARAESATPAFPVETIPRAELPYLVAVLALPGTTPAALRELLAAWLAAPESFPEGPVAALRRRGGRVSATSTAGGMLFVAEGSAADEELLLGALQGLVEGAPSSAGLPPARAVVLVAPDDERRRVSAHAAWWGGEADAVDDEAQIAGLPELELRAALALARSDVANARVFLEGASARPSSGLGSSSARRRAALPSTRPPLDIEVSASFSQPLPTEWFDEVLAAAYVDVVTAALRPSTPAQVRLELAPGTSVLVFETLAPENGLSLVALRGALTDLRQQPPATDVLEAALRRAELHEAAMQAPYGGQAVRRARALLLGLAPGVDASRVLTLRRLLQLTLLPEVLRPSPPLSARAAAAAPSASSRPGPG